MKRTVVLIGIALLLSFSWVLFAGTSLVESTNASIKIANGIGSSTIVKTSGDGYLEESEDLRVLHISGSPYEMGYQHGFLLADDILENFGPVMIVNALWRFGITDVSKDWDKVLAEAKVHEQYTPPDFRKELRGIADGLKAAGSPLTYDDVLVWNVFTDVTLGVLGGIKLPEGGGEPSFKEPFLYGCSSFSAWDDATVDGKLVYGRNADGYALLEIKKKPTLVMGVPKSGHAFVHPIYAADFGRPGTIGGTAGMNEAGIVISIHASATKNVGILGTPAGITLRYILQNAGSVDEAITILSIFPRTVGLNWHVADGKTNEAAVIEVSASEIAVRRNEPNRNVLWTTNHYNCYPGWQGYGGYNIVLGQQPALNLSDISSVEKWQTSLHAAPKAAMLSSGINTVTRYDRYNQLLNEKYGKIDINTAIDMISDRYDATEGKKLSMEEWGKGYPIARLGPVSIRLEDIPYWKSGSIGSLTLQRATVVSLVAIPSDKVMRVAMGEVPAQAGPFVYFDMDEALGNTESESGMIMPQSTIIIFVLAVLLCCAIAAAVVFAVRRAR